MKTIGFDLRPIQTGFKASWTRGIGVYARNLIERRDLAPERLSIAPFHDPFYEAAEPMKHGSRPYTPRPLARLLRPRLRESVYEGLLFRRVVERTARAAGADLMFFPASLDAPAGLSIPYAVTAHDMIQAAMESDYLTTPQSRAALRKHVKALRGARLVIAVSAHTKDDVTKYAGVEPDRIKVVHNGVDPLFSAGAGAGMPRLGLPEDYILNVGGIDKRKNFDLLLEAFAAFSREMPKFRLVMAGEIKNDPQYPRFARLAAERGVKDKIVETGFISRAELAELYRRARVFFYPSLYEGFGLPVLEAMASGAPVVGANRSSIPEVAGGAAILLDPDDTGGFVNALLTLARSGDERERLSRAGIERAAMFSWDSCAKRTYEALASAA